jgi:N-acetylneuraminate synthase
MSTTDQIRKAVEVFKKYDCPFELMHSNSTYPMKLEEANLHCIETLRKEFDCKVGYSGHEDSAYIVCVVAAALGATSIERHITLSRSMYGSDQAASLEEPGLSRMVRDVRRVNDVLGDGVKRVWDSEIPVMKKLRKVL